MFPEKYIKDLESSQRRRKYVKYIFSGLLFITGFLLIGPGIHELSHAAWLELHGCIYDFQAGFSYLTGINGEVAPACTLGTPALIVFYSIGYFSTLLLGTVLDFYARATPGRNFFTSFLALGVLLSVLTTIGIKGDLAALGNVIGAPKGFSMLSAVFISLGVASLSLMVVKDLEGKEGH